MSYTFKRSAITALVVATTTANVALCAPPLPELHQGDGMGAVVAAWGTPGDKVEHEAHRREVWKYPKGASVTFQEGKVTGWTGGAEVVPAEPTPVGKVSRATGTPLVSSNADTRDLVREIAREVPSAPDAPFSEPAEANPAMPPPTGFVAPPAAQGQPGLVPGVQVLQPEED